MRILRNSGFSLVEVLVASAILVLALFSFASGFISLFNISQKTALVSSFDKQINEICSNIKAGVENYQVNFNYADSNDKDELPAEILPMAWDIGVVAPKDQCARCQGRFGYTIRPLESMRGLYSVKIRFTHQSWGNTTRDFAFIVGVK